VIHLALITALPVFLSWQARSADSSSTNGQLFIRSDNEPLSVAAMSVGGSNSCTSLESARASYITPLLLGYS